MKTVESKAEVFLMALRSLSRAEKDAVIARLLDDPDLREDILDLITIYQRREEPSRSFREYLAETRK
jgi:hypothetical protein